MSDEEVVKHLQDLGVDPTYFFVFGEQIEFWSSFSQMLFALLEDDSEIAKAIKSYLIRKGQVCKSDEEVDRLAKRLHWPGWQD
jgi:hypothetical protein